MTKETVAPLAGDHLGRFEVIGVLGHGGMGVVVEALDPTLGRRVAIKLLHAEGASAHEAQATRLLREAQALARLSHPNVVTIYEAGREGERVYLAMELVTGATVRAWLDARPRTIAEIRDVYRQAATGLAAAHRAGLVHRDVKPENILVGDDGRVRVTDFGLVAAAGGGALGELASTTADTLEIDPMSTPLTRTGTLLGTPPYMAPEAHSGAEPDAFSDQWSLGVAWWEAIAGVRPFAGASYRELASAICDGTITRGTDAVPMPLRQVLERSLSVEPTARWPSVTAMIAALDALDAEPPRPPPRPPPRRLALPIGVAVVTAAAAATTYVIWPTSRASVAPTLDAIAAAAAPPAAPIAITEPGGCPYMPVFADDERVVYDDGLGDLWQVVRPGEAPTPLVENPHTEWRVYRVRPGTIVYSSGGDAASGAAQLEIATGHVTRVPIWSASIAAGGGALFYGRTDLPEVRRRRGDEDAMVLRLPEGQWPYTVAASNDGRRLAIITNGDRGQNNLCLIELDPSTDRPRGEVACLPRADITRGRAAFTPDGETVYYQTTAGIRRRTVASGDDTLWLPGVVAFGGIDVAPGGAALVYSDARPVQIELVSPAAPEVPVLSLEGEGAVPGADGRWFFVRATGDGDELVERLADGTQRVLTPPGLGRLRWPSVDRSGLAIAFEVDSDAPGIYVVDTRALPPVRVTTRESDLQPVWLDDGRIAFTRFDAAMQPSVIIADPGGWISSDLDRRAAHPAPRVTGGAIRATGELILFDVDGTGLRIWDPVKGKERAVPLPAGRSVEQATASPDGRWIAILSQDQAWRLPVPEGPADRRQAERLMVAEGCITIGRPTFDDGGRLLVPVGRWLGDVYTVRL